MPTSEAVPRAHLYRMARTRPWGARSAWIQVKPESFIKATTWEKCGTFSEVASFQQITLKCCCRLLAMWAGGNLRWVRLRGPGRASRGSLAKDGGKLKDKRRLPGNFAGRLRPRSIHGEETFAGVARGGRIPQGRRSGGPPGHARRRLPQVNRRLPRLRMVPRQGRWRMHPEGRHAGALPAPRPSGRPPRRARPPLPWPHLRRQLRHELFRLRTRCLVSRPVSL